MNLKREIEAVNARLDKIEKTLASLAKATKPAKAKPPKTIEEDLADRRIADGRRLKGKAPAEKTTKKVTKKTAKKTTKKAEA